MVGFGESGSGTFSLSACCAQQILNGKNATTTSKMKNWQRRKFRLSLGRMKCTATYHLSTAIRVPRIKHVLFHRFRRKAFRPRLSRSWCRRSYYRRGTSASWTNFACVTAHPETTRCERLKNAAARSIFQNSASGKLQLEDIAVTGRFEVQGITSIGGN